MRTFICIAAAVAAATFFGNGPRAEAAPAAQAKPAVERAAKHAAPAFQARQRRRSGAFSNWCAYNCYAVPRCDRGRRLGRYAYTHYAYDEDLPFRYRLDWEAGAIDNAGAVVYGFTGEPAVRAFERVY